MVAEPRDTLLAIVGLHGSGKTTVAAYLSSRGWATLATGSVIRAEARNRGLPETWDNLSRISLEFFEQRQHTIIPNLETEIRNGLETKGQVGIDGVKTQLELAQLQMISPRCFSLAVLSSPLTRHRRLVERGRTDDMPNPEKLKDRDDREIAHGLGTVIARSDFFVINEGSRASLEGQVEQVIDTLRQLETARD